MRLSAPSASSTVSIFRCFSIQSMILRCGARSAALGPFRFAAGSPSRVLLEHRKISATSAPAIFFSCLFLPNDTSRLALFAPTGGLCTACRNSTTQLNSTNKQIRNIVRFFSRISGGPGDGPQIVRFFPGFPAVQGMVRRL